MLSIDLAQLAHDALLEARRPEDGMLHPSGDIAGPLRHTMLRMAGAPMKPERLASLIRLNTGTMWHEWLGNKMQATGMPFMREVSAAGGLPYGWNGTADFLIWEQQYNAFVLADLKTNKASGLPYIERGGAKYEHIVQISAYWHAFVNLGYPMLERFGVLYLPMDDDYSIEDPGPLPIMTEVVPLPQDEVYREMHERKELVDAYLKSLPSDLSNFSAMTPEFYLTPQLAAPMAREQKLFKNKGQYNLVLVPHWTAMFCPYSDELCPCGGEPGEDKTTKIGKFDQTEAGWEYTPRPGYEHIEPLIAPKGRVR